MLYDRLFREGFPAVLTHEPGDTPIGNVICRLLKWGEGMNITPLSELFLFNAARSQLVESLIKPELDKGRIVICDRFADSTTVYQGYARGLALERVKAINAAASQDLKPQLTILLDLSVEAGSSRQRQKKKDRFEKENTLFHQKVRRGYLELAANEPERWLVIDALQDKGKIAEKIWQKVSPILPQRD
jgi:dTMP kinase